MAAKNDFNIVIIDTAGRLHIDEDMMASCSDKRKCHSASDRPCVDAMTGQDADECGETFGERIGIDGSHSDKARR